MSNQNNHLCSCGCGAEVDQLTPHPTENTPGLSALSYRAGTHHSFKESMLRALATKAALRKLTSRYDDDFSVATIDAWATVLDVLTFYQERIINEGYLETSTERYSVLELARHINYTPRPGVAASTHLVFSMNDAPGAPAKAIIPIATKVQSIPEQNQNPQLFETIEELEARVEWNSIPLQTSRKKIPVFGDREIYLKGITTGLQKGDAILMIGQERETDTGSERWDFRKVVAVYPDSNLDLTRIIWDRGLGKGYDNSKIHPAAKNFKFYALRQRTNLFGYNAPEWRAMSKEVRDRFLNGYNQTSDANTETEWKGMNIETISASKNNILHLDGFNSKIVKDSWIVLSTESYEEVYKVSETIESSRKQFTLASKTTKLKLEGENLIDKFNSRVRDAAVYGQSEELEIAEGPVYDAIKDDQEITLQKLLPGLTSGKTIFLTGKRMRLFISEDAAAKKIQFVVENSPVKTRTLSEGESLIILKKPAYQPNGVTTWTLMDKAGTTGVATVFNYTFIPIAAEKEDETVSELHVIDIVKENQEPTALKVKGLINNYFDLTTVMVQANVAAATHGETKSEVLGSGNGSLVFQKFQLKQNPLTYISAATASGTQTSLQVRVNDILWKEMPTFFGSGPKDKIYTTRISEGGKVTVQFGDGITGSRLPTGVENIRATYRVGIGTDALVKAGQLSMLLTPQLGVNKVTNPLPATGAENPETLDNARNNAPLTVLTLDRIVSTQDFEDFTAAFAGIAKAKAEVLWSGEQQIVYITIASEDQTPLDKNGSIYENLINAIHAAGHSNHIIQVDNYVAKYFTLEAKIKVHSDYLFDKVKQKVEETLKQNFSFTARTFGQQVTPAEIMAVIQKVEGVIYTDIDKLNGQNPFATKHYRIPARLALWQSGTILPAELLMIHDKEIVITAI
ncbi:MAG TPA: putative baseplate assembly protein [Flavipsychrobacter sp.]|nr:putative baseplate assembly protein [Flavipsychrobacter sp.]